MVVGCRKAVVALRDKPVQCGAAGQEHGCDLSQAVRGALLSFSLPDREGV